ncbi:hypothetical protein Golax_025365 [Gossypium laxum]|uniref:Uncharacterized protein n=1 Tax=Gossypium laxum TaxID=34288 RepID=A0A7J9B1K0_9ROSI|nr:hypothetical protein [Gossypium laxum]
MHSLEEFKGFNSNTPRGKEEGRCLCLEYIWLSYLPQSLGTC